MDLLTEYNHFMWECNHLAHRSPENKRNVGICWAKSLIGLKLNATYTNIMQHSPTWCTNERNMLYPTCWRNMLRSFARALTLSLKITSTQFVKRRQSQPTTVLVRTTPTPRSTNYRQGRASTKFGYARARNLIQQRDWSNLKA